MGLSDRDYARDSEGRSPGGRKPVRLPHLGTLSITTWLIIINVAVFAIDALLPPNAYRPVYIGGKVTQFYNSKTAVVQPLPPTPPAQRGAVSFAPIIDSQTGQTVGQREFRWMPPLEAYGHLSTDKVAYGLEVWRFITFQFLHADVNHLLFNMMGLFFFGPLVEQALRTRKRFLSFYLVCGIFGALLYIVLNLLGNLTGYSRAPLLVDSIYTPLIGASAGVFGVLMAAAYVAGEGTMLVFMVLPMRIRTGAYLLAAAAAFNLFYGGSNAGGDAAHVGGAIAGYFFIRRMHLLNDFFDVLGPSGGSRGSAPSAADQKRLDAILDKVHHGGIQALTRAEQKFLKKRTSRDKQPPR